DVVEAVEVAPEQDVVAQSELVVGVGQFGACAVEVREYARRDADLVALPEAMAKKVSPRVSPKRLAKANVPRRARAPLCPAPTQRIGDVRPESPVFDGVDPLHTELVLARIGEQRTE